jgi:OmpA-OmpF porin, OOP family
MLPCMVQAQSGLLEKIKNRAKAKAEQRVVNRADKEIDKTLDEIEGKNEPAKQTTNTNTSTQKENAAPQDAAPTITAYSKYDFVPGEKIIYAEDFSQDEIGELPLGWNTAGKAELVTLDAYPGRWLRLYQNAMYLTSNKDTFSRNFTVEFDLILQLKSIGYSYPQLSVGVLASNTLAPNDNELLERFNKFQAMHVQIRPSEGANSSSYLESSVEGKKFFLSETQSIANIEKYYHKVSHIAMQVQGSRVRVWINGEKRYDLPMALPTSYMFNQLFFKLHHSSHKDEQVGVYVGNLKVATGKPDTRHKLVEEGKFSTTGILFNVNAAVIKPESAGVMKEIADVLKKFPEVKVMIVGHTDSDGQDAANLSLSQKRAAAVKESLVKEYGIEEGRIQTDGKGEKEPVGDNKTREGKAQNRRVEFIKLAN